MTNMTDTGMMLELFEQYLKLDDDRRVAAVDSVSDGVVAFDSAKALSGHCVYDFVPYQTIRPVERAGPYSMVPQ